MEHTSLMPQFPEPYWRESVHLASFPKLTEDIKADVAIIGGGISGITTAYLLIREGFRVALIDAGRLLNGTTGHTTAKITAQHDLIYDELINNFGIEQAKLYYEANHEALQFIKQTVRDHRIECELTEEDAYIYTNTVDAMQKLSDEFSAYEKLGIFGKYVEKIPLPFEIKGAIVMKNQAQFHPLHYVSALLDEIKQHGAMIYENTTAIDLEEDEKHKVITRDGYTITSDYVVSCSHFPFYDRGFYFTRMYPERSYVLAVQTEKEYPGGMYLSAEEPKRSLRSVATKNGEKLVLFGGESHKTGQGICTIKHYEAIEHFAHATFGIKTIPYRWSAQDLITLDKIPYIGALTSTTSNLFVATGFKKWGMTSSTVAALLLRDLITEKENPYTDLYAPARLNADPSVKSFFTTNVDVAKHLIEGKMEVATKTVEDLHHDEGAVVSVNGERAGAYKDQDGNVYLVDTTCRHLGCEIEWNSGERTWDCPCHGSRYSIDGDVIEGPAKEPLKKIE